MRPTRRQILGTGGGVAAALFLPRSLALAAQTVDIVMTGGKMGTHVWFEPTGIRIAPGQTVRWINRDKANAHTATAYHPENFDRSRRIPARAKPWDSDYLLPDETFSTMLTVPGVYDYYCVPHEQAGMVGRIIVGEPDRDDIEATDADLPQAALQALPPIAEIMATGRVSRTSDGG